MKDATKVGLAAFWTEMGISDFWTLLQSNCSKTHLIHNSTEEGARKKLCRYFSDCPGSQRKYTTKLGLPAFSSEMINR